LGVAGGVEAHDRAGEDFGGGLDGVDKDLAVTRSGVFRSAVAATIMQFLLGLEVGFSSERPEARADPSPRR
jgi:hypothetical protein